jgi:hypothetical protein
MNRADQSRVEPWRRPFLISSKLPRLGRFYNIEFVNADRSKSKVIKLLAISDLKNTWSLLSLISRDN